jgi:Flp pilus assembly pilin Flp
MTTIRNWITSLLTSVSLVLHGGLTAHMPARVNTRRGVTLIEYVLLAAGVLAIILLLTGVLSGSINNLFGRIRDALGG